MDIRDWPIDRIMQLPDCAFGRRWWVGVHGQIPAAVSTFLMSEEVLPERYVIWELFVTNVCNKLDHEVLIALSLGERLPATAAEFSTLNPMFPGLRDRATPSDFSCQSGTNLVIPGIRKFKGEGSRKLVVSILTVGIEVLILDLGILVSSIPTEVPDWLCSGRV